MRLLALIAAVFMATTASAQEMRSTTDASGTKMKIPVQPHYRDDQVEEVLPGWCDVLTACAEGRYVMLQREHAAGTNFGSLEPRVYYIVTHVGGGPGVIASEEFELRGSALDRLSRLSKARGRP